MNSLTPLIIGDFIKSLEKCMKDSKNLIETQKHIPGMERCVELSQLCIEASSECLVACNSIGDGRVGKIMQSCVEACKSCAEECENMAINNVKDDNLQATSFLGD